tara:strand:+ start:202386 stop:203111 length:726 start_codon:yes stop_codon:yes gene_type:complete
MLHGPVFNFSPRSFIYPLKDSALRQNIWQAWKLALGLACLAVFSSPASLAQQAPDLSGIWMATSPRSILTDNMPELTARARADIESFDPLSDPIIRCVMPGFPRSGLIIYPFEIVQTDSMILFLYESFGMVRRIYMDGRQPPDYLPPSRMGYSLGHWEQDELVIETHNIAAGLLDGTGLNQYGDITVQERYRLTGSGELQAQVDITAPQTFAEPWSRLFSWERDPEAMIFESVCDPADSRF